MTLAFVQDGTVIEYPVSPTWVRKKFSNVSFPKNLEDANLSDIGVVKVKIADTPTFDSQTQKLKTVLPELINGVWTQGWSIVDLTKEEKDNILEGKASSIRSERDQKLAESDWRVIVEVEKAAVDDLGIQYPMAWAAYRQALRDITKQSTFPNSVEWPVAPQ